MTGSPWLSTGLIVVNAIIVVYLVPKIIIQRRESAATLAWVLFILLLPLGGAMLYHLLGTRRMKRRRRKRQRTRERLAAGAARVSSVLRGHNLLSREDEAPYAIATRRFFIDRRLATLGNEVTVYHHGDAMFRALEEAISKAKTYVHVEFYIFHPDKTGLRLIERLEERARAGIEVRLLVDAVGARELRQRHVAGLLAAGGKFAEFLPLSPVAKPFSVNFRNHRKIVVIDGHTAFTGGMNVGDEYRGRTAEFGSWRDTHVMLRGPGALRLQEIFADDWHYTTSEECIDARYYPSPEQPGSVVIEVVDSGPDNTAEAIHRKLFTAVTKAEQRVWLTTPYFIPDRAIVVALSTAAMRGVDVRLLLPGTSDHALALYAGRSYYDELLASGARIYEYQKGMLHAKTMVVDDLWTTIGSANMDMRSFVLNWEANLIALDRDLTARMADRFLMDLRGAVEITPPLRRSVLERFREAGCFVLSPLL